MVFKKNKFLYSILLFYIFINHSLEHEHVENTDNQYQKYIEKYIRNKIKSFSKLQ